jgi:hypothetical protein
VSLVSSKTLKSVVAVMACLCSSAFAQAAGAAAANATGPGSLAGIWQGGSSWRPDQTGGERNGTLGSLKTPERNRVQRMVDGNEPPMQAWASELLDKRIKASQAGAPENLTLTKCLPGIPVLLFGGPYPIQILETPGQVTMLLEEQNHFRNIYLNAKHPEDPDPTYMGHSVGHWEGGTLVVDTIALVEQTPLDRVGMPHSDQLHVIERWRRVDENTLELLTTIDDPKAFTKSWDTKTVYRAVAPGVKLTEYICENNRDDK